MSTFAPEARDGEPSFLLVARDPMFACMVEAWAYLRTGRTAQAKLAFDRAVASSVVHTEPQDLMDPQILSAWRIAESGRSYFNRMAIEGPPDGS